MAKARRVSAVILYDNKDISASLAPYLTSLSVTDVMDGEADSVEVTMEDKAGLWHSDWFPERGAMLTVSLKKESWESAEDTEILPLGKFEIDEPAWEGPPDIVKIKGVSIPSGSVLRSVKKSRTWEKVNLSQIVSDIAADAGMESLYDTDDDPLIERAEQTEQSDLQFLRKQAKDAGLALKVSDEKIVIFEERKYEEQAPVATLTRGASSVISYSLKATIKEIYKACHVKYNDAVSGELIEYTFTAPGRENMDGLTLEINEDVKSIADAEKLAKGKLREKNSSEYTISLTCFGNFLLSASSTVTLSNFGVFDGKYIITKATHSIGGGYTTKIDLRKCLNGY